MVTLVTVQWCAVVSVVAWAVMVCPPAPGDALWDVPPGWLPAAGYVAGPAPAVPVLLLDLDTLPADEAEHLAEGEGSLLTLAETGPDPDLISARERQAAVDAWVHETADEFRAGLDWSRVDAAVAAFLAPIESVDRARLEMLYACNLADTTIEIPRIPALTGASA